ncbi:flavin-containing monooxygenase [Paenibacillus tyrfis]|uniref:flavin-containing monooxygenase n=1 Tax=Paenibacillus tyrfis TaxID=1501230 RepID=UPI00209E1A7B|nr:NAD(P)/FAD-dependent oxidoreductase [Paenibacillus tyrfis]MCP1307000.1 NAD(P)/FAD-dependent oxidoreductase [Paenibacillus tyrfis]
MKQVDVLVIGAGQAGLAMGYYLKQQAVSFALLDASDRIGNSWRNRYDSLVLFTPRKYSLPGMPMSGDPSGLPTKDEVADYLEAYAERYSLPVQLQTQVISMTKTSQGFLVETNRGTYRAGKVIVATGPFHTPFVPGFASGLPDELYQTHSSAYRNSGELLDGPVLVVGAGNSGAQIAAELSRERLVYLSAGSELHFKPLHVLGKSIFWYFDLFGFIRADKGSLLGSWLKRQPEQIYGLELKSLMADQKVLLKPRAVGAKENRILFEDGSEAEVSNIVWATGYRSDYRWIRIDDAVDSQGNPIHRGGVSPVSGLYYLGLPWQSSRGSALLGWVGRDAAKLAEKIRRS